MIDYQAEARFVLLKVAPRQLLLFGIRDGPAFNCQSDFAVIGGWLPWQRATELWPYGHDRGAGCRGAAALRVQQGHVVVWQAMVQDTFQCNCTKGRISRSGCRAGGDEWQNSRPIHDNDVDVMAALSDDEYTRWWDKTFPRSSKSLRGNEYQVLRNLLMANVAMKDWTLADQNKI